MPLSQCGQGKDQCEGGVSVAVAVAAAEAATAVVLYFVKSFGSCDTWFDDKILKMFEVSATESVRSW